MNIIRINKADPAQGLWLRRKGSLARPWGLAWCYGPCNELPWRWWHCGLCWIARPAAGLTAFRDSLQGDLEEATGEEVSGRDADILPPPCCNAGYLSTPHFRRIACASAAFVCQQP